MGVSRGLYLGPYLEIEPITRTESVTSVRCSNCDKKLKTDYCPHDGGVGVPVEEVMSIDVDVYELMCDMGEEWDDFIVYADPMLGESNVYLFNTDDYSIDTDNMVVLPIKDIKLSALSDEEAEFVEKFKTFYGKKSITVKYGLVSYFH